jgi:hypothetical protein
MDRELRSSRGRKALSNQGHLITNREIGLVWMAYILAQLYDNWPGKVNH